VHGGDRARRRNARDYGLMKLHTACAVVAALFVASSVFAHTVSLRMLFLAAGIVLASMVVARARDVRALPSIWIPFVAWGAWALISLAWSMEPERTLKEWRNEVFYTGAGLWICYVGAQARYAVWIFGVAAAAAAVLASIIAIYEFSQGLAAYAAGWHGGPGDHSSALLVLIPCVAMAGWYASRARWAWWGPVAAGALGALMVASGYTTQNRTLWLALAAQFAVLGGLQLVRAPALLHDRRFKVALSGAAIAVILGLAAVLMNIQASREAVGAKAIDRDHRLVLWPQVALYIEERPLSGYGFGRGVLGEDLQEKFKQMDQNLWHAHNLFLEALVQLGVPGLVLLLVLLGVLLREGWRTARHPNEAAAACGMALLGVIVGMLIRNMTDSLLVRQNALLFWGVTGALLAWGSRSWRT